MSDAPYYVVQEQLKASGGNPAALMGNVLALEKLVLNLVNRQNPNSIASQMSSLQERELLDNETVLQFVLACKNVKNWVDEYRKAVNFFSQEYRNKNSRNAKPMLDMDDNVIPFEKKGDDVKSFKRFTKLEMD